MSAEKRLQELGIELPAIPKAGGNYVHARRHGDTIYLSGKTPGVKGKLGDTMTVEEGYAAARQVALYQLAVLRETLGSLDKVTGVIKVLGMVNAVPEFGQQPAVINGFSDLIVAVFGEIGRHARSAVGMGSLPNQVCVEIEAIVAVGE